MAMRWPGASTSPVNYGVILMPGIFIQVLPLAQISAPLLGGLCDKHRFMYSQIIAGFSYSPELTNRVWEANSDTH